LGRYAFVTNQADNTVSQFTIGANGALTANGTASLPPGSNPYTIAVDSTGNHAYVANRGTGKVSQFNIDGTGALVPMTVPEVAAGSGSLFITINPAGTYAYVTNFDPAKTVSQFSINATTGALTAVATVATGNGPYPVVISPNGQYAYWSNKYDFDVAQCVFAAAGALDCSAGVVGAGAQPQYIAIDPFGKHLFVANYSAGGIGSISQYDITPADGTLTSNAVPTATTGAGPFSITTAR
jgi:6-phosphogluconolactonase